MFELPDLQERLAGKESPLKNIVGGVGLFGIPAIIEQLLGGNDGVSALGEAREAITGGCLGLLMSGGFLFAFFFTLLAWLFKIEGSTIQIRAIASPLILLLCVSSFISPFIGILWGARGGRYSMGQHMGCFVVYLGLIVILMVVLSVAL